MVHRHNNDDTVFQHDHGRNFHGVGHRPQPVNEVTPSSKVTPPSTTGRQNQSTRTSQ